MEIKTTNKHNTQKCGSHTTITRFVSFLFYFFFIHNFWKYFVFSFFCGTIFKGKKIRIFKHLFSFDVLGFFCVTNSFDLDEFKGEFFAYYPNYVDGHLYCVCLEIIHFLSILRTNTKYKVCVMSSSFFSFSQLLLTFFSFSLVSFLFFNFLSFGMCIVNFCGKSIKSTCTVINERRKQTKKKTNVYLN